MKNKYLSALISSSLSIVPMVAIIFLLSVINLAPLRWIECLFLGVGMFLLIAGLTLFQIGAGASIGKVGEYMGESLSKQKNLFIVVLFSFTLGALITCAEPSIMIVTKQVQIPSFLLIGCIAVGVGTFVVFGVLRVIFHKPLKLWYVLFYGITFMLLIFVAIDPEKSKFLPFIFDSGGVTTGSATVPFILSLGAGVAIVRGGRNARDDSFGLVGMASIGPVLSMTILILINSKGGTTQPYAVIADDANIFTCLLNALVPTSNGLGTTVEVAIALAPILVIFIIYDLIFLKLPWKKMIKLFIGFLYSYVGLVVFLCATGAIMTPLGASVGKSLGTFGVANGKWIIVLVAFLIGLVTILCEPAVHVLTTQIVEISDGAIRKRTVIIALSLGVGIAIGLAALRTVLNFSILYIVVPGYILSFILMFFCPDIYVAMAFDSGGTASGPMSSSFVLPMIAGLVGPLTGESGEALQTIIFERGFGVVALIALTPILAIQLLGVGKTVKDKYSLYLMRKYASGADDAQIIHF